MFSVLFLVITFTIPQLEGLSCFQCKSSTDYMGHQKGCSNEVVMQLYLLECEPPMINPINQTKANQTMTIISESKHPSNTSSEPVTEVAPGEQPSATTNVTGPLYCFTQISLSNDMEFLIEHGCGPLKDGVELLDTCDESSNSTTSQICYCESFGCNGKMHYEHHEEVYLQNSNSPKSLPDNKTYERDVKNFNMDKISDSEKEDIVGAVNQANRNVNNGMATTAIIIAIARCFNFIYAA